MRVILVISIILFGFCGFCQRNYHYGVIKDVATQGFVEGAHISNRNAGLLTSTNDQGKFKIPAQPGDTLVFTHVGYEQFEILIKEGDELDELEIWLTPKAFHLPEVEVTVFPEYWRFQQMIIDEQPIDSSLVVFGLDAIPLDAYDIPVNEQNVKPPNYNPPTISIAFDMGGLTKKAKEKRKLQKVLERKNIIDRANAKFNREWVSQETKLSGDELTDFIAYCKFTPEYLIETSLFEIHKHMMALLEDFNKDKEKEERQRYSPGA